MKTMSVRVFRVAARLVLAGVAATGCLTAGSGRAPIEGDGGSSNGGNGAIGQGGNIVATGGRMTGDGGIIQRGQGGIIVGQGGIIVGQGGIIVGQGGIIVGQGGATGGGGPGGSAGVAADGGGGGPADECNPVNGFGCLTFGTGCEPDAVTGKFECVPGPNTLQLCQSCDPAQGLRCAAGLHCFHGQCARYCCDDESDCGASVCDKTEFGAWGIGVCVTTAGGTTPVCSATSRAAPSGSCFVQTGPVVSKQPYETCVSDADCAPTQGSLTARCLYGACRGICAGQTGPLGTCPTPSASLASGVTVECLDAGYLGMPCCRTMSVCTLTCTTSSTCPPGTDCYGGHCLAWDPG